MRLTLAALAIAAALIAAAHGWLRGPERGPAEIRTVAIEPLDALEAAPARRAPPSARAEIPEPPPERVEEQLEAQAPFVEAPLVADAAGPVPDPVPLDEAGDPEEADAVEPEARLARIDQDAWAARIRRMLAVYERVGAAR